MKLRGSSSPFTMSYKFQKPAGETPPDEWIYKYYLSLKDSLDGQRIRLHSIFNSEKTPSMFLYVKKGKYYWKDHSSGKGGDALDLAQELFKQGSGEEVTFKAAILTVKDEYKKWVEANGAFKETPIETHHYLYDLVCEFEVKEYSNWDLKYWSEFGIDRDLLDAHYIKPLQSFRVGKKTGNVTTFNRPVSINHSYGFFLDDGTLTKIYNPYYTDFKHITLKNDILGRQQLGTNQTLIICSSMKDMLCLKSLDLGIEAIAPIGEKVIIKEEDISMLKTMHKNILTMFDNDKTGVRAMMLYKSLYDINYVYLPYYKDIAEFKQTTVQSLVKREITIAISKKIFKSITNEEDGKDTSYPYYCVRED